MFNLRAFPKPYSWGIIVPLWLEQANSAKFYAFYATKHKENI
jgi:hypothetical protein